MVAALQLAGKTFGELTAIESVRRSGFIQWVCRCSCGKETIVSGPRLVSGKTKSCGHLRRGIKPKHGAANSPEYGIWCHIKQRCFNPNHDAYRHYGGRGIRICERWRSDFTVFLADIGRRPFKDAQIDRINNDGDYEPGNVRWVTPIENKMNRRNTTFLTHAGTTLTAIEWCKRTGLSYRTLRTRLSRGWPVERALSPKTVRSTDAKGATS